MAGTITHLKIGKEVLKKINGPIDEDIFLLACQGHDLLYFIKLKDFFHYKNNQQMAKLLQDTNFSRVIEETYQVLENNDDLALKSFLYGYVTHHLADSIIHPFIIYHSGFYKKTEETKKYQGQHEILESVIDSLIIDNIHNAYKEFPSFKKNDDLKNKVESIFNKVYHTKNIGNTLVDNMKNVRGFLRIYRSDVFKIKRCGYVIIDKLTGNFYEFLSFNYPAKYKKIDLNEKVIWYHPITKEKKYSSFNDLYDKSIKVAVHYIELLEKKQINKLNLKIASSHGLEENIDYEFKYFKY